MASPRSRPPACMLPKSGCSFHSVTFLRQTGSATSGFCNNFERRAVAVAVVVGQAMSRLASVCAPLQKLAFGVSFGRRAAERSAVSAELRTKYR